MNNIELINALKNEGMISKREVATIVNLRKDQPLGLHQATLSFRFLFL